MAAYPVLMRVVLDEDYVTLSRSWLENTNAIRSAFGAIDHVAVRRRGPHRLKGAGETAEGHYAFDVVGDKASGIAIVYWQHGPNGFRVVDLRLREVVTTNRNPGPKSD